MYKYYADFFFIGFDINGSEFPRIKSSVIFIVPGFTISGTSYIKSISICSRTDLNALAPEFLF